MFAGVVSAAAPNLTPPLPNVGVACVDAGGAGAGAAAAGCAAGVACARCALTAVLASSSGTAQRTDFGLPSPERVRPEPVAGRRPSRQSTAPGVLAAAAGVAAGVVSDAPLLDTPSTLLAPAYNTTQCPTLHRRSTNNREDSKAVRHAANEDHALVSLAGPHVCVCRCVLRVAGHTSVV